MCGCRLATSLVIHTACVPGTCICCFVAKEPAHGGQLWHDLFSSCNALKALIVTACIEHVIYLCINTQSASIGLPSHALLQQWLVRQDSSKASKGAKQNHGEAAKVWLELKSSAVQDLVAWQDAVIAQDVLPSAADIRSACKVGHCHCDAECMTANPVLH